MTHAARSILVVDDDLVDRHACRRAFHGASFGEVRLVEAASAAEALAHAAAQDFDCLLLDYGLPDMDGLELLQRLSDEAGGLPQPIVMLTGADDVTVAVRAMRLGASDYLVKDVQGRYEALIPTVVERAIASHQVRRDKLRAEDALARSRDELSQLTRQLLSQEKELSRRVAQALHDRLGQTLVATRMLVEAMRTAPHRGAGCALVRHGAQLDALTNQAMSEVREVLVDLWPALLDELGVAAAIDHELDGYRTMRLDLDFRLEIGPGCEDRRWPGDVEHAAFMIAREALCNAVRHAEASTVRVRLDGSDRRLHVAVTDDGCGIGERPPTKPGRLGLVGMRERAEAIGARHRVAPNDGGGTCITLDWEASP